MISPVSDQMPADLMTVVGAPGGIVDIPVAFEEGIAGETVEEIEQGFPLPFGGAVETAILEMGITTS